MFVYLSKFLPYLVYPAGIITILALAGLIFCRSAKAKNLMLWLILLFVFKIFLNKAVKQSDIPNGIPR